MTAREGSFSRPPGTQLALNAVAATKPLFPQSYPQAIGGEIEGVGLAAAAVRHGVPWIIVKAICDWADGEKHKKHQPLAAAAAVSLVHHVLTQVDVLHGLDESNQTDVDFPRQLSSSAGVSKQGDAHQEKKRQRDLATIEKLLTVFPRPVVDNVLDEALSDRIRTDHIDCLIDAERMLHSTLFHLYDTNLRQLLEDFFNHWNMAWDVGRTTHHDHLYRGIATLTVSETDPPERWDEHERYLEHVIKAQGAMVALTRHLSENFPDFDLVESDRQACVKYWEMAESVEKQAEDLFGNSESRPAKLEFTEEKENSSQSDQPRPNHAGGEDMSEDATREYLIKISDLKGLLVERSRNGQPSEKEYATLRAELVDISEIRDALPTFVLKCRTIQDFWDFIKPKFPTWKARTDFLQREFDPLIRALESSEEQ